MEAKPTAGAAEEGAPERPAPPEREAARGAAQPEPEPDFCEQLAEPEPFVAELVQLAQLRSTGMLSEEEFAAAKAKLLGTSPARQSPEPNEPDDDDTTHGGAASVPPAGMSRQLSGATATSAPGDGSHIFPTAAEFCGPTTGISLDGLLHMVELLEARHAGEPDIPREGDASCRRRLGTR